MATGRSPADVLRPFQLNGVRDTGKTVGDGSYATVKELDYRGLKCVGKIIHAILYNSASPQEKAALLERFASECELLSRLHHPCIVQFLGVYFERGSQLPVMVMEYLHTTLAACLDQGVLPEEISYEILRDVILGLRYLHEHSPPILHRDLSANNVLLATNMSAKISDLGVAKILNLSPARLGLMTQTQTPGTPSYMPPEAMVARPKYTNKVDIFSYGVMMVHVLSGQWPIPGEAFREDPNHPEAILPVSEFDRRAEFLQGVRQDHPLMGLIRRCLSNVQSRRPEAVAVHEHINTVLAGYPPSFLNRSEMLQRIHFLVDTLSGNATRSRNEIDSLQTQVERLSVGRGENLQPGAGQQELTAKERELRATRDELAALRADRDAQKEAVAARDRQLRAKEQEIASKEGVLVLSSQASMSLLLNPQSKVRWKRRADMPVSMAFPHVVRINNDIYTGGGYSGGTHTTTVSRYNPAGDTWSALPKCPTDSFGLTELEGKPVLVGGDTGPTATSDVYTLEDSREWRKSLPPLPTARFYLTVFRYESFLIACGGITSWTDSTHFTCTTAVEVFSSKTSQWYKAEPLPIALNAMSHAIINDTCYLIGGGDEEGLDNRAFCASLPSLVQQATAQADPQSPTAFQSSSSPPSSIWRELPRCPCHASTAAGLGGCLLAIGGQPPGPPTGVSTLVHLYSPSTNSWVRVSNADIPEQRYNATATQLASGDIILMGGRVTFGELCNTVFVGSIEF